MERFDTRKDEHKMEPEIDPWENQLPPQTSGFQVPCMLYSRRFRD